MGQRLNVNITKNGETIANVYMHWSAYSSSSMNILQDVIYTFENEDINENSSLKDVITALKDALPGAKCPVDEQKEMEIIESTKLDAFKKNAYIALFLYDYPKISSLDVSKPADWTTLETILPKKVYEELSSFFAVNRNDGIISITPNSIKETESWEEGRVSFDIATHLASYGVFYVLDDDEKEDYADEDKMVLPVEYHNLFEENWLNQEDLDALAKIIDDCIKSKQYRIQCGDDLISLIE